MNGPLWQQSITQNSFFFVGHNFRKARRVTSVPHPTFLRRQNNWDLALQEGYDCMCYGCFTFSNERTQRICREPGPQICKTFAACFLSETIFYAEEDVPFGDTRNISEWKVNLQPPISLFQIPSHITFLKLAVNTKWNGSHKDLILSFQHLRQ